MVERYFLCDGDTSDFDSDSNLSACFTPKVSLKKRKVLQDDNCLFVPILFLFSNIAIVILKIFYF